MDRIADFIEATVLTVHRRNGGTLEKLDFTLRFLAPQLSIDSLDLAEIMVAVEKQFGIAPFDAPNPPRTWGELAAVLRR